MNKNYDTWLSWNCPGIDESLTPEKLAELELENGFSQKCRVSIVPEMGEGWSFSEGVLSGGETGVLYGAYTLIGAEKTGRELPASGKPGCALRMLNCWDNATGFVERGYSGRSLFFEGDRLDYDRKRMFSLGRMLASVGINTLCINNVNVHEPAQELLDKWLGELSALAAIFRVFGIRLMVSIDYSMPMRYGIPTADPLDSDVRKWWKERAAIVWNSIPDLAGFLVKADSEHRPGPFTYGRSHADGANMLAEAVKPYGGIVVWRCFVYNCMQDWRDTVTDRAKAAYDTYMPLDGCFADNVILQIKHGPFDFQVREPVSPLLLGLKSTNTALELQLAQEYTGQQIDIYAMPPMWKELFSDLGNVNAIAAVTNLGRDANYTGHPFAALNLYAYGRFAWNRFEDPAEVTEDWCRLTYDLPAHQLKALTDLLLGSRAVYEKYTSNLGLGWMVTPNSHYGPNPYGYEFQAWGTYNRADRNAVGVDRTSSGTCYTEEYPAEMRDIYSNINKCPENLLLFFHRLPYNYVMKDGRTLIQRLYDEHFEGAALAEKMKSSLEQLDLPSPDREIALERMDMQVRNAKEWCDITNTFFHRFSGIDDAHGRRIYE